MIACATGWRVRDVLKQFTAEEVMGWLRFFQRHPPDGAERVTSYLAGLVFSGFSGKRLADTDIRPWTLTPEARKLVKSHKADHRLTGGMDRWRVR